MSGRFTLRTNASDLDEIFTLLCDPELTPRFNIAAASQVAVIRQSGKTREISLMRWGLVPSWLKDPKAGPPLINARADAVVTRPSFRSAFKRRRRLVPVDGFFEWKRLHPKTKLPYYIRMAKDRPFALAGLWERWHGPDGETFESSTIVTTERNDLMRPIHDRMPVILADEEYARWLDPKNGDVNQLQSWLQPYPAEEMTAFPINTLVNRVKNQGPECITRLSA
jgi:putative SOS response-associated peptidase YedK